MYINAPSRYYKGSEQCCRRAPFLLLQHIKGTPNYEVYGLVRKVALHQCGHWMMGTARIMNKSVTVSGAYGNDGLIEDVDQVPPDAVRLPKDLYEAWRAGVGWNSAGSEATLIRAWAKETFK